MLSTHRQKPIIEEETDVDFLESPDIPHPFLLKAKIENIHHTYKQWEKKKSWTYSKER